MENKLAKKLAQLSVCAEMVEYTEFEPVESEKKANGGRLVTVEFTKSNGNKEKKELCVVYSKYRVVWEGDCYIYLPTLQFSTPKREVYMITPDGNKGHQLVHIGPRITLGNIFQTKGAATAVFNYYSEKRKDGYPVFRIDDKENMPLGKKVRARVVIQEKENEKGLQLIVDCFVYSCTTPAKDPGTEKFLAVQKFLPAGFKAHKIFNIEGEDRKVFVCEK